MKYVFEKAIENVLHRSQSGRKATSYAGWKTPKAGYLMVHDRTEVSTKHAIQNSKDAYTIVSINVPWQKFAGKKSLSKG